MCRTPRPLRRWTTLRQAGTVPDEIARMFTASSKKLGYTPGRSSIPILARPSSPTSPATAPPASRRPAASACWAARPTLPASTPPSATAPTASTGACCPSCWTPRNVLDNGDYVYLPGIRKALLEAADEMTAIAVKPDGGLVEFSGPPGRHDRCRAADPGRWMPHQLL